MMKHGFLVCMIGLLTVAAQGQDVGNAAGHRLPAALDDWKDWVLWDEKDALAPSTCKDASKRMPLWLSTMGLDVTEKGGIFTLHADVFSETWLMLPGGENLWPEKVSVDGTPAPVMVRDGKPSIRLKPGGYEVTGGFSWKEMPQKLVIPDGVGLFALTREGVEVPAPVRDENGVLWLKREATGDQKEEDYLIVKMNALVSDGLPMWLEQHLELSVAGKSREERIGAVLPEGWLLASMDSPIPVAVDENGVLKAQVRAGKWVVKLQAFRNDPLSDIQYAPGARSAVDEQFVGFRAEPGLRTLDLTGGTAVDASQVDFPPAWKSYPVYRWQTNNPLYLAERMRGGGDKLAEGVSVQRDFWIDEDGGGMTYRDLIRGKLQTPWRIDAAHGYELGLVREGDVGQLITLNPSNGLRGVELRKKDLSLLAAGRVEKTAHLDASGWASDLQNLSVTMHLPPGWQLFALFGADWVSGDWLTSWTLLDMFLLLLFALAVWKMFGLLPALLAFAAFGLSYHEPGAPRYLWLILLVPLALEKVVPEGGVRRFLTLSKWAVVLVLVMGLFPFMREQIQQSLYPQLEDSGPTQISYGVKSVAQRQSADFAEVVKPEVPEEVDPFAEDSFSPYDKFGDKRGRAGKAFQGRDQSANSNLLQDSKARVQTGPGIPDWKWNTVSYGWSGPIRAGQTVRPVLIPQWLERILSLVRVVLLLALARILFAGRGMRIGKPRRTPTLAAAVMVAGACLLLSGTAMGQYPDATMLDTLKARLLERTDAFPHAAEIAEVDMSLVDDRLAMDVEIHAAERCGVPLPGKLVQWSPVRVTLDGQAAAALTRDDGSLWLLVEPGVHHARVEGVLTGDHEWQWTYELKPHRVKVEAPGWTVTGIRPNGSPENQVFFSRVQTSASGEAKYDQPVLHAAVEVRRHIEMGLVWQVRTTVTRLTGNPTALSLRVPLLAGEKVLSEDVVNHEEGIEVRLGSNQQAFTWVSTLPIVPEMELTSRERDPWVERWLLEVSPVWNLGIEGAAPVFEERTGELLPVWRPWPGESMKLHIGRPEAVAGSTVTVGEVNVRTSVGKRQLSSELVMLVRASLGEDLKIDLPGDAKVSDLTVDAESFPVRMDGGKLIVPVTPGSQHVEVHWKQNQDLGSRTMVPQIRLPGEAANIHLGMALPYDRWVLWTWGPRMGPAVQFWPVLAAALLVALVLGRLKRSPLRVFEWMLLAVGLTQLPLPAALVVVAWFFVMRWRGEWHTASPRIHNLVQLALVVLTVAAMVILVGAVMRGLLGGPEMFIRGNGSHEGNLAWYRDRCDGVMPAAGVVSVSIWWFRLLMLLWALWLAAALIRWLRWAWTQFIQGGILRRKEPKMPTQSTPHAPAGKA